MSNMSGFVKTLAWFLVLHVTIVSYATRSNFVTTDLTVLNGMLGMKRPDIVYHCQSVKRGLDYGWRRATNPPLGHAFLVLLEGGQTLEEDVHHCHFRSVLGTVDLDIRMTSMDAEICNIQKACAVHVVTPQGIMFEGKEWSFEERYPKLVRRSYLEAKWKPWPRRNGQNQGRSNGS